MTGAPFRGSKWKRGWNVPCQPGDRIPSGTASLPQGEQIESVTLPFGRPRQIGEIVRTELCGRTAEERELRVLRGALGDDGQVRALWAWIRTAVERAGAVVVRGAPRGDRAAVIGLSMALGVPQAPARPPGPTPVATALPTADQDPATDGMLHTDSPVLRRPPDYVGLVSRGRSPGGGDRIRLLGVERLRSLLEQRRGRACVRALEQPVYPFELQRAQGDGRPIDQDGSKREHRPVLSWSDGGATVRYRSDLFDTEVRRRLYHRYCGALEALDSLLADEAASGWVSLASDEMLLFDNRRVLYCCPPARAESGAEQLQPPAVLRVWDPA
jgi:hypothetical protein